MMGRVQRLAAGLSLMLAAVSPVPAGAASSGEYDVKAVFLFRLVSFVDWPEQSYASTGGDVAVCVLGHDPFGSRLERAFGSRTIRGRSVTLRRAERVGELGACHIVFVSDSKAGELGSAIRSLEGRSVLTVSDVDSFLAEGGMIQLSSQDARLRFSVNPRVAERAGLRIDPKLLKLAADVRTH